MRLFTIKDALFGTEPVFIFDCTHTQLTMHLKKHYDIEIAPEENIAGQMLTFQCCPWRVVWVEKGSKKNIPTILHELFHLTTRICADKGIPIVSHHETGESGDETAAYLFEFFAKAVLRKVRR